MAKKYSKSKPRSTGWFWARRISTYPQFTLYGAEQIVKVVHIGREGMRVVVAEQNATSFPLTDFVWARKISNLHTKETRSL